jgi:hypothetical protein
MLHLMVPLYTKPELSQSIKHRGASIPLSLIHSHRKPARPFLQSFIHCVLFWLVLLISFYYFFSMHLLFVACINLLHVVHISRFKNILQVCCWPVLHSNGFPLILNCLWSLSQFNWYILVVYILNLCKSIAGPYWSGTRWSWTLVFNHRCLQILRRCWSASFPCFHLITSRTVHRHSW